MKPYELIAALMKRENLGSMPLAKRMNKPKMQSHIWRFMNGLVANPARSTAVPLAAYFRLPVDAIYDSKLATSIAAERGITALPKAQASAKKKAPAKALGIDLAPEELELVLAYREQRRSPATGPAPRLVDRSVKRTRA